jgi:hypothetical protein
MVKPPHLADTRANTLKIQQWRFPTDEDGDVTSEIDEKGEIARLCQAIIETFQEIIHNLSKQNTVDEEIRISLERSCCALILWSDGYGIAKGDFDDIFGRSCKLRQLTTKALSHIGEALTERKLNATIYAAYHS